MKYKVHKSKSGEYWVLEEHNDSICQCKYPEDADTIAKALNKRTEQFKCPVCHRLTVPSGYEEKPSLMGWRKLCATCAKKRIYNIGNPNWPMRKIRTNSNANNDRSER